MLALYPSGISRLPKAKGAAAILYMLLPPLTVPVHASYSVSVLESYNTRKHSSMAAIDKNSPIPRYEQVRIQLLSQITAGRYAPGDRVPGERQLAEELKVSQMTVNKAILALVDSGCLRREHGRGTYVRADFQPPRPNFLRIGVALCGNPEEAVTEDYYMGALFRGIQKAVANTPHTIRLLEAPPDRIYDHLANEDVDGFVVLAADHTAKSGLCHLAEDGRRVVTVGMRWDDLPCPSVDSDNVAATRLILHHLQSLGHTRIAGVFGLPSQSNTQHRLQVFHELAGTSDENPVIMCNYGWIDDGVESDAIYRLLTGTTRPTAVFAGGYQLALGILRIARQAGFRVPDDLSLVGFDDPESASHLSPPLTTVRQPLDAMGYQAMASLIRWISEGQCPEHRSSISGEFIIRESTSIPSTAIPSPV